MKKDARAVKVKKAPTALSLTLHGLVKSGHYSQIRLSEKSGVSQGQISRYLSRVEDPSVEKLDQICKAIKELGSQDDMIAVAIAHLNDQTPPSAKDLVRSSPAGDHGRKPFGIPLDKDLESALRFIAERTNAKIEVRDAIISSAMILGFSLPDQEKPKRRVVHARRSKVPGRPEKGSRRKAGRRDVQGKV